MGLPGIIMVAYGIYGFTEILTSRFVFLIFLAA
jgi:hypothetical protein